MLIKTKTGYKSLTLLLYEQFELNENFDTSNQLDVFIKNSLVNAEPFLKIVGENSWPSEKLQKTSLIPKTVLFEILRQYRELLTVRMKVGFTKIGIKKYTTELLHKLLFEGLRDATGNKRKSA